jgi:thiamine-monophosphate kinase
MDVSDGLVADAGKIAAASGVGMEIDLDRLPLSEAAAAWLKMAPDPAAARLALATGGDDYEILCSAPPEAVSILTAAGAAAGSALTPIGVATAGSGVRVSCGGREVAVGRGGYVHR